MIYLMTSAVLSDEGMFGIDHSLAPIRLSNRSEILDQIGEQALYALEQVARGNAALSSESAIVEVPQNPDRTTIGVQVMVGTKIYIIAEV
jgi:hypothetical protein